MSEIKPGDLPPINEIDEFTAGIPELQTDTDVLAGTGGPANFQAQALANRTKYLKRVLDLVGQELTGINQAVATAQQSADTAKQGADASMKKSANRADIVNPAAFRTNIGLSNAMLKGEFGWGGSATVIPSSENVLTYFSQSRESGIYSGLGNAGGPADPSGIFDSGKYEWILGLNNVYGTLLFTSYNIPYYSASNILDNGTWRGWVLDWNTTNLPNPVKGNDYGIRERITIPPGSPLESFFTMSTSDGKYAYGGEHAPAGLPLGFSDVFIDWSRYFYPGGATIGCIEATGSFGNRIGLRIKKLLVNGTWSGWSYDLTSAANNSAVINEWVSAPNSPFIGVGFYNGSQGNWPRSFGTVLQSYQRDAGGMSIMQQAVGEANAAVAVFCRNIVVAENGAATYGNPVEFLHTGNTTVGSGGALLAASPVINIYSDGSFTANDEASGVDIERLSEGVYRITGCQGMNADPAWSGIDGGVKNPVCRNGQELTWNNYEVHEDGSITVYTFHRVHPDAMQFAQNQLTLDKQPFDPKKGHRLEDTWPDQTPIDVPRGAFIQVRVNMPERIESTPTVMHSNVYCNSVSPAK